MRTTTVRGLAAFALTLSCAAIGSAAPTTKDALEQPYFAQPPDKLAGAPLAAEAAYARGSLDVAVVVGLVRERVAKLLARATADAMGDSAKGSPFAHEFLVEVSDMLVDPTGIREANIHALGMAVLRLSAASTLAAMVPEAALTAEVPGSKLPPAAARLIWTSFLYARLERTPWLARKPPTLPDCGELEGDERALCEALAKGGEAEIDKRLDQAVSLGKLLAGVELASRLVQSKEGTKHDVRALVAALASSQSFGDLSKLGALGGGEWPKLTTSIAARLKSAAEVAEALRETVDRAQKVAAVTAGVTLPDMRAKAALARTLVEADKGAFGRVATDLLLDLQALEAWNGTAPLPDYASIGQTLLFAKAIGDAWKDARSAYDELVTALNVAKLDPSTGSLAALANRNDAGAVRDAFSRLNTRLRSLNSTLLQRYQGKLDTADQLQSIQLGVAAAARLAGVVATVSTAVSTTGEHVFESFGALGRGGASPLLDLLLPLLPQLAVDKPLDKASVLRFLANVPAADVLSALGVSSTKATCEQDAAGARCWIGRVLNVVQGAITVEPTTVRFDGDRMARSFAAVGDDFSAHHTFRPYFHLTVGIGGLWSHRPPRLDEATEVNGVETLESRHSRVVPLVAEQIGLGLATPSFWQNRGTAKLALVGSGLLYRLMIDSQESKAMFAGGAVSLNLYETLDVTLSGGAMLYPVFGRYEARGAMSLALQVPLGDYLLRL